MMRELLAAILAGEFAPETMLPKEQDLAQRWEVSRGVVRETIRALEERGVLTVRHGRGATVRELDAWDVLDPEVLGALLAGRDAGRVVHELLELRRALDVEAAKLAAERRTEPQLEGLSEAVEELRAARNAAARYAAEMRFHRRMVEATANRVLAQAASPLLDALERASPRMRPHPDSVVAHERIPDAIRRRRASAASEATAEYVAELAPKSSRSRT